MSETPRTDAAEIYNEEFDEFYVTVAFARQLERDLCMALAEKHQLRHDLGKALEDERLLKAIEFIAREWHAGEDDEWDLRKFIVSHLKTHR